MVRAGLGPEWQCLFANDIDPKKARAYASNWSDRELHIGDVAKLTADDLPGHADMAWASFPCQDLSLAGWGKGLDGERSGTFFAFHLLMGELREQGRAPKIIVLENVAGLLTSRNGADFVEVARSLVSLGYRAGVMAIDAAHFVPQSRPRVFFVAVRNDVLIPPHLISARPVAWTSSASLEKAVNRLKGYTADHWVWWNVTAPAKRTVSFGDVVEATPRGVAWHTPDQTSRLLSMMSEANRLKVERLKASKRRAYATVYRRTRPDGQGGKVQRAEVRVDGTAGCLRTASGGSSRQIVLEAAGGKVRSRLLSPREAARLMGLPENYKLPETYNEAYHLLGDGVAACVVDYLSRNLMGAIFGSSEALLAAAE